MALFRFLRYRKTLLVGSLIATGYTINRTDFFHSDLAYVRIGRVALMVCFYCCFFTNFGAEQLLF